MKQLWKFNKFATTIIMCFHKKLGVYLLRSPSQKLILGLKIRLELICVKYFFLRARFAKINSPRM